MGTEVTQVLHENFGPMTVQLFLKIETDGAKTRCAGCLFQNFTIRTEKAPLLRRRRDLVDRLGVGGGVIQTG